MSKTNKNDYPQWQKEIELKLKGNGYKALKIMEKRIGKLKDGKSCFYNLKRSIEFFNGLYLNSKKRDEFLFKYYWDSWLQIKTRKVEDLVHPYQLKCLDSCKDEDGNDRKCLRYLVFVNKTNRGYTLKCNSCNKEFFILLPKK